MADVEPDSPRLMDVLTLIALYLYGSDLKNVRLVSKSFADAVIECLTRLHLNERLGKPPTRLPELLPRMVKLQHLSICSINVERSNDLSTLALLPTGLQTLKLSNAHVNATSLTVLTRLTGLRNLELSRNGGRCMNNLSPLSALTGLDTLNLDGNELDGSVHNPLECLKTLSALTRLSLAGIKVRRPGTVDVVMTVRTSENGAAHVNVRIKARKENYARVDVRPLKALKKLKLLELAYNMFDRPIGILYCPPKPLSLSGRPACAVHNPRDRWSKAPAVSR